MPNSGTDIEISSSGDIDISTDYMQAGGSIFVTSSGGDISNSSHTLNAGDDVVMSANNIYNRADAAAVSNGGSVPSIIATNMVSLDATSGDIVNEGGNIEAGTYAYLTASNDIINKSLIKHTDTVTGEVTTGHQSASTDLNVSDYQTEELLSEGSIAGTNVVMVAGNDITNEGSNISSTGETYLEAGNNVNITSSKVENKSATALHRGVQRDHTITNTGSDINVGTNLTIISGNDTRVSGSNITTGGNIDISAGGSFTEESVEDYSKTEKKWKSGKRGRTKHHRYVREAKTQVSSKIESTGGNISISSGNDLTIMGSDIISSSGDASLHSDSGDIVIENAVNEVFEEYEVTGGGLNYRKTVTKGSVNQSNVSSNIDVTGNLTITTGSTGTSGNVNITGSNVRSDGNLNIGDSTISTDGNGDYIVDSNGNYVTTDNSTVNNVTIAASKLENRSWVRSETNRLGFDGYRSRERDYYNTQGSLSGSNIDTSAMLEINSKDIISISGSDVSTGGDVFLNSETDTTISGLSYSTAEGISSEDMVSGGLSSDYDRGRLSFGVDMSGDSMSEVTEAVIYEKSNVTVGGSLISNNRNNFRLSGSDVTVTGDIDIRAGNDLEVSTELEEVSSSSSASEVEERLSYVVGNAYVDVGYALDDLNNAQKSFEDARRRLTEAENDPMVTDLEPYKKSVAMAKAQVSMATLKVAAAAGTAAESGGTGMYANTMLSRSESSEMSEYSNKVNVSSSLRSLSGNTILRSNNDVLVQGSTIASDVGDVSILSGNDVTITASEDVYSSSSSSDSHSESLMLSSTSGSQMLISGSYSEDESSRSQKVVSYNNSDIRSSNGRISIISTRDTNIESSNVSGKDILLTVGRNINMESFLDTETIRGSSEGYNVGLGTGNVSFGLRNGVERKDKSWIETVHFCVSIRT